MPVDIYIYMILWTGLTLYDSSPLRGEVSVLSSLQQFNFNNK